MLDRTSLADPGVIRMLNDDYIPIRVDAYRRPDINDRHNQGGWPTTAVLLPAGRLLTGATCLPPDALAGLLEKCRDFYRRGDFAAAYGSALLVYTKGNPGKACLRGDAPIRASRCWDTPAVERTRGTAD